MLAIRLNNIYKRYLLEYRARLSVKDSFLDLFRWRVPRREFWALKGISLEVAGGQALGIIGENGSGKSTLLRLICSITKPTKGGVEVNGRVLSLLELGAGFEGDLTGRENIYLNGSILGLSRREIHRSIDSIIDFAAIGDFIDAPVRTYSAGMYLRLGFAIAAQLNPDILVVDEVLSVGDMSFQKKCFQRIREFTENGGTLILVSHNMDMVRQFCDKVIWLREGRIFKEGGPDEIIREYSLFSQKEHRCAAGKNLPEPGLGRFAEITNVHFLDRDEKKRHEFLAGEAMVIRIEYNVAGKIYDPVFGIGIYRSDGILISGPNTKFSDFRIESIEGKGSIDFTIDSLPFLPGDYELTVALHDYKNTFEEYDCLHRLFRFSVKDTGSKERYGLICVPHSWKIGKGV